MLITELIKSRLHHGVNPRFYFWQKITDEESSLVAGIGEISNFDLVKDLSEAVIFFTEAIY